MKSRHEHMALGHHQRLTKNGGNNFILSTSLAGNYNLQIFDNESSDNTRITKKNMNNNPEIQKLKLCKTSDIF